MGSMDLAVIRTGGKQYVVSPGRKIKIEKVSTEEGKEIVFKDVLLLSKGGKIEIGKPSAEKAAVKGKVLSHGKSDKVVIFKYKPKKRYKIKKGHRQPYSEVEITGIG